MELTDISRAFKNGDFARPNLFKVTIPFLGKDFEFKCKAATMPSGVVEQVPVSYQNKKFKIAGDRTYDDWTISVYNDMDHDTRQQFVEWQNMVQAMNRDITGESPDTYKKQATVSQVDRQGNVTRTYTLYGIWPTNIAELALDWDNASQIEMFDVTFAIDWWE